VIIPQDIRIPGKKKMPASHKKISEIHHRAERFSGTSGFGIVTYRKGGRHGPRWQPNYQLVVLHRGSVTLLVDGVSLAVKAGMGILLAPGHVEEFQFSRTVEARHSWCQVLPEDLPEGLKFPSFAFHRTAKCPHETMALIRLGLRMNPAAVETRPASALVLAAMWAFVAALGREQEPTPDFNLTAMGKFHAAVESLGSREATLEHLARESGVSRGHLIKLVREHLGVTPMERVWRSRVTHAAKLLRETGLSVAEVAHQTGFANAYHFSRRFRQQFGQPPRAWRIGSWGMG